MECRFSQLLCGDHLITVNLVLYIATKIIMIQYNTTIFEIIIQMFIKFKEKLKEFNHRNTDYRIAYHILLS